MFTWPGVQDVSTLSLRGCVVDDPPGQPYLEIEWYPSARLSVTLYGQGELKMRYIVGIDVSKEKLDCLWLRDSAAGKIKTKVVRNTSKGHLTLTQWLTKTLKASPDDILVVMEATGIYHERLAHTLYDNGFGVSVVNPAHIKSFAKSLGRTHKTDKQDSLVIAQFGESRAPMLWQPEPREIRELKALIARLDALEKDCQREENRYEKAEFNGVSPLVMRSIEEMIQALRQEIKRIEQKIDDHIDRHPKLKQDAKLLKSIPGVGPVTTRLMLAVFHSRPFTNARQVAAYLGVIPAIVESGKFKGRSALSKKGPGAIRAKLYMAAVSAKQHNPDVKAMTKRLTARGKTNMQALGAAMRKLVHICFGVVRNQTVYSVQAI